MTVEAFAGDVAASAEPIAAPIDTDVAAAPHALGSQIPETPKETKEAVVDDKPSKTVGDAVRKATEQLKAKEADKAKAEVGKDAPKEPVKDPKAVKDAKDAKPVEAKAEQPRGDGGKFAAKQPQDATAQPVDGQTQAKAPEAPQNPNPPHREPPSRFSADAKAAWEAAPDPVKAEVHRAVRELESGIEKYRTAHEEIRPYDEMARQSGTTLKEALHRYTSLENVLRQDPIAGLEHVVANLGLKGPNGQPATLRDIAAHILNEAPDQAASRHEATIQKLHSEISELKQQLSGVSQHIEQQQFSSVENEVKAFASKPEYARFDELAEDIAFFLNSGKVDTSLPPHERLSEAYKLAERLNPAPAKASEPPPVPPAPQPKPLNPAGQKSISGAPSSGSNPAPKASPPPSIKDALKRAHSRLS